MTDMLFFPTIMGTELTFGDLLPLIAPGVFGVDLLFTDFADSLKYIHGKVIKAIRTGVGHGIKDKGLLIFVGYFKSLRIRSGR